MNAYEKELEVYRFVKENACEFMPVIINALCGGIIEENARLKEQKSKVEVGIVTLIDEIKLGKLDKRKITCLTEAIKNCSFIKMDSFLKELEELPNGK